MRTAIVNVSMPAEMLEVADKQARKEMRNRSEFFRECIRWYLIKNGIWGMLDTKEKK